MHKRQDEKEGREMDHGSADRLVGLPVPPPAYLANTSSSLQADPTCGKPRTGSLRARRFPPKRIVGPDGHQHYNPSSTTGSGNAMTLTRTDSQEFVGASFSMPSLHYRHYGDPMMSLVGRPSLDSMVDLISSASPVSLVPAPPPSFYASKDSITVQDHCMHQNQYSLQRSLTFLYPPISSPSDPYSRGPDFVSARGISATEEDANEDRVQVRVEGFFESSSAGLLIPNDLPRSTLLYVLTASDGRDLLFKLIQYTLQLTICFLHTPLIFSPEVQGLTGPVAERLYRNYNTIRHGRSLFKMGRGLLNLFMLQGVLERMWSRYENSIASCLEKVLVLMGVSPERRKFLLCKAFQWIRTAKATHGLLPSESPEPSTSLDGRTPQRMCEEPPTSPIDAIEALANRTHAPASEANTGGGDVSALQQSCTAYTETQTTAKSNATEEHSTTRMFDENCEERTSMTGDSTGNEGGNGTPRLRLPPPPRAELGPVDDLATANTSGEKKSHISHTKPSRTTDPLSSSSDFIPDGQDLPSPTCCMAATASEFEHATAVAVPTERAHPAVDRGDSSGRKTLLHPLRPKANMVNSTASSSRTGEDISEHIDATAEGSVTHDDRRLILPPHSLSYGSMTNSFMQGLASGGGFMPGEGPLSGPNHWPIACAPTVPPSHSENFACTPSTPHPAMDLLTTMKPNMSPYAGASAMELTAKTDVTMHSTSTADSAGTRMPPKQVSSTADASTSNTQADMTPIDDVPHEKPLEGSAGVETGDVGCNGHSGSALAPTMYTGTSSTPNRTQMLQTAEESKEGDVSILASSTNSGLHARAGVHAGTISTWLRELQPASAALPARWRKGVLDFNPVLMSLLGIRNLAAACRRFLRDITILSTEKFGSFNLVEVHRHAITRAINRCWFVVSVIDLILNTVRLLKPGWVKYATARENIQCRCGCSGDDDPSDIVWRTHGCIARRKTDLFFPPLDLDYGAPFVSSLSYVEAADPAKLMPACSRCGFLYREIPHSEQEDDEVEAERRASSQLYGAPTPPPPRTVDAILNLFSKTPVAQRAASTAASHSEDGHRAGSHRYVKRRPPGMAGSMEREGPRWLKLYQEEVRLGESQQLQSSHRHADVLRETHTSSGGVEQNAFGQHREGNSSTSNIAANGPVTAEQSADEIRQRREHILAARKLPSQRSSGILFVPWIMRKFFDYLWLLRIHPNLTSTVLLEARCIAELYLAYKYCFGDFESFHADAPLSGILNPYGALAGIVSASVGLLRVIESAPSS